MTVRDLIAALQKASDQDSPVNVLDKSGEFRAAILTVDEDPESVHIVIED